MQRQVEKKAKTNLQTTGAGLLSVSLLEQYENQKLSAAHSGLLGKDVFLAVLR